jgi:hypothetical protein
MTKASNPSSPDLMHCGHLERHRSRDMVFGVTPMGALYHRSCTRRFIAVDLLTPMRLHDVLPVYFIPSEMNGGVSYLFRIVVEQNKKNNA